MDASEFRVLGHEIVDLLSEYLSGVDGRALYPEVEPFRTLREECPRVLGSIE